MRIPGPPYSPLATAQQIIGFLYYTIKIKNDPPGRVPGAPAGDPGPLHGLPHRHPLHPLQVRNNFFLLHRVVCPKFGILEVRA